MSKLFGGKNAPTTSSKPSIGASPRPAPTRSPTPKNPAHRGTYISAGSEIEGRVKFMGPTVLACNLTGEIQANDMLIIEEGCQVQANVHAANVIVRGMLKGDIFATDGVEIGPSGQYEGVINAPKAKVAEGAEMRGSFNISSTMEQPVQQQQLAGSQEAGNVTPLGVNAAHSQ